MGLQTRYPGTYSTGIFVPISDDTELSYLKVNGFDYVDYDDDPRIRRFSFLVLTYIFP